MKFIDDYGYISYFVDIFKYRFGFTYYPTWSNSWKPEISTSGGFTLWSSKFSVWFYKYKRD